MRLWDSITETLNKLSYISAGTISLSITFLGYMLSIGSSARQILHTPFVWGAPILYLLFLSWILLFLSLFLGIIVRLPNAWYLFNSHAELWFKDMAHTTTSGGAENYRSVVKGAKGDSYKYHLISTLVRNGAVISFVLGIISLVTFVVIVASDLTNL